MEKPVSTNKQIIEFLKDGLGLTLPFNLPFDLVLSHPSKVSASTHFHCTQLLNLIPNKRLVLKAAADGVNVLIKLFPPTPKGKRQYARELKGYSFASAVSINIPSLLASYERKNEFFCVIYQFLDDAKPLSEPLLRQSEKLITGLFKMMAAMHAHGIYQRDIHLDNILLDDCNILNLIDFGSVKCEVLGSPLSKGLSIKNMTKLVGTFPLLEQDKVATWMRSYYKLRTWQWDDDEGVIFDNRLRKNIELRKKEALKNAFSNNTLTRYGRNFSTEYAFCKNSIQGIPIGNFVENIEGLISKSIVLSSDSSVTLVKTTVNGMPLLINSYCQNRSWWQLLSWRKPFSQAAVSWKNAQLLDFIQLPTLKPVGFIEKRTKWFKVNSYFITQYEQTETILDAFCRREPTQSELREIRNIFLLLQNSQTTHGNLHAQNLIINEKGRVALVNLEALEEHQDNDAFQNAFSKDKDRFLCSWKKLATKKTFQKILSFS